MWQCVVWFQEQKQPHFCVKYESWVLLTNQNCCLLVSITSLSTNINVSPYTCRFIRDGEMCNPPPSNKAWCKQSILGKEKILNNMTWVYFRWPRFLLQRTQTNFLLGSLVLVDPNTFWPGLTFPWLHGTNAYIEFVSLRLESLTKHVHRFPPPCESKQILTWVHFPSACFLKFYWRSFRSASGHQHTYRIRFPWPARPNWLSSLSLVDPNKFWPGFTFPQPSFSNFIGVRFAQPLNTNIHIGFASLGLLDQTDSHHSALCTQTKFDLGSLYLSLVSQILFALVSLRLWTPTHS